MNTKHWTLLTLSEFCNDNEQLLNYLFNKGLIPQSRNCPNCGWGMKLYRNTWKCSKKIKSKKGTKVCNKKVSINKNTFFDNSKLSYKQILLITYMIINNYSQNSVVKELNINKKTVSQWSIFLKQVMIEWLNYSSEPIGGVGKIVEVDESKFGKRKYNGGWVMEGQWVFGGICHETKKLFLVPVENRSSSSLITIIKQWILPGSTIVSNCCRGYKDLGKEGYEHLTVNHSVTFIDSNTGAHTNSTESTWQHVKEFLPSYNRKKKKFIGYLAHYMFSHQCKKKHADLFETILEEIAQIKFSSENKNLESGSEEESSSLEDNDE